MTSEKSGANESDVQGKWKVFKEQVIKPGLACFGKKDKIIYKPRITKDIIKMMNERRSSEKSRDQSVYRQHIRD